MNRCVITAVLQMVNKRFFDESELARRGRCGYVGLLVAIWNMVIAGTVLTLIPLKNLPHGPFVVAEGDSRG